MLIKSVFWSLNSFPTYYIPVVLLNDSLYVLQSIVRANKSDPHESCQYVASMYSVEVLILIVPLGKVSFRMVQRYKFYLLLYFLFALLILLIAVPLNS